MAERILRGFLFLSRRIFLRIFSPDFFSSFLRKKCPEKSSRKIPGKILRNLYNKNPPTHFCRLAGTTEASHEEWRHVKKVRKVPDTFIRERKKHININECAGLSRDWVGVKKLFMCFFGSFLMGEKKHINKIPPQNPGTIP